MGTTVDDIVGGAWAESDAPVWIQLPDEWPDLARRYAWLGPSVPLTWIFQHVKQLGATRALIESYIDADYRDEYQQFYTLTFTPPPDRCERLHFWRHKKYIGYCTLRPIPGRPVCRTLLPPLARDRDSIPCMATSEARPYGASFAVTGFPFMGQDLQYGRCAHAVIWMISYFHHLHNRCPRAYMSDIVEAAEPHESERLIPSAGLTDLQVGVAFRRLGLPLLRYEVGELPGSETVESIVCRYVNSRIPLALVYDDHMVAIIGCGQDEHGFYAIISDDANGAYLRVRPQVPGRDVAAGNGAPRDGRLWRSLLIPLPGRIYLAGEAVQVFAAHGFGQLLQKLPSVVPEPSDVKTPPSSTEPEIPGHLHLQIRTYATHSRAYKAVLDARGLPAAVAERRIHIPMPRWIWVAELQDATLANNGDDGVVGELIVDATSDALQPVVIDGNMGAQGVEYSGGAWHLVSNDAEPGGRFGSRALGPAIYRSGTALSL